MIVPLRHSPDSGRIRECPAGDVSTEHEKSRLCTGTYAQEGGFFVTATPDVMVACGGDSLDQQYFELLDAIVAGGPDGAGGLALETAGG